jgi:hypothetical protein
VSCPLSAVAQVTDEPPTHASLSGLAQLSMHSIRETSGVADVKHYINFMAAFLGRFGEVDGALTID